MFRGFSVDSGEDVLGAGTAECTGADECLVQVGPCSHCGWTGPEHRFSLGDYQGAKTARDVAALERDEHRCEGIIAAEREHAAEDDEPHQT